MSDFCRDGAVEDLPAVAELEVRLKTCKPPSSTLSSQQFSIAPYGERTPESLTIQDIMGLISGALTPFMELCIL
jgi:hypothetical protein